MFAPLQHQAHQTLINTKKEQASAKLLPLSPSHHFIHPFPHSVSFLKLCVHPHFLKKSAYSWLHGVGLHISSPTHTHTHPESCHHLLIHLFILKSYLEVPKKMPLYWTVCIAASLKKAHTVTGANQRTRESRWDSSLSSESSQDLPPPLPKRGSLVCSKTRSLLP